MDLRGLAEHRPVSLAGASFALGVAALLVSIPPITVATTQPQLSAVAADAASSPTPSPAPAEPAR